MDAAEVAKRFTEHCKADDYEAAEAFWADDVVSIEAMPGEHARLQGRDAIKKKHAWWEENFKVHSAVCAGPYVNGDQFALTFDMDVTGPDGTREQMTEVALYTVREGKIVEEKFLY
ncbi:MAG: nuclear transport factor 2 family protein [Pseudomonadota bacterium]